MYLLAVYVYEIYISISDTLEYIIIFLYIMSPYSDAPGHQHIGIYMYTRYLFMSGICVLNTYIYHRQL